MQGNMPERGRLHILVEGQTEETIAREIIDPYLTSVGWWVTYSIVKTKRPAGGPAYKGGVISWEQVQRETRLLLRDSGLKVLTTVLDYYAFPAEAPGMDSRPSGRPIDRVEHVEGALRQHFKDERFLPHLTLHETEAWVFAARTQLAEVYGNPAIAAKLQADIDLAGGVEMVNDNPATAPSKRLLRHCPGYLKTTDGPLAVADLGLGPLRLQCPHLDAWLDKLSR
jgi:hypothetical protein